MPIPTGATYNLSADVALSPIYSPSSYFASSIRAWYDSVHGTDPYPLRYSYIDAPSNYLAAFTSSSSGSFNNSVGFQFSTVSGFALDKLGSFDFFDVTLTFSDVAFSGTVTVDLWVQNTGAGTARKIGTAFQTISSGDTSKTFRVIGSRLGFNAAAGEDKLVVVVSNWYANPNYATIGAADWKLTQISGYALVYLKDVIASDSGHGVIVAGLFRPQTQSETGSGADAGVVRGNQVSADTGAGSVSGLVGIGIIANETGHGSVALTLETADAKDTTALASGSGVFAGVTTADVIATEAGSGSESFAFDYVTDWSITQFATGRDCACSNAPANLPDNETGSGVDSAIPGIVAVSTGAGVIAAVTSASLSTAQTGASVVSAVISLSAADSGAGTSSPVAGAGGSPAESGSGADSGVSGANVIASEAGSGSFVASLSAAVTFAESGTEFGAGAAVFVGFAAALVDSGSGSDTGSAANLATVSDAGAGVMSAAVYAGILATASGAGIDSPVAVGGTNASDSGHGVELLDATADGVHIRVAPDAGHGVDSGHWCILGEDFISFAFGFGSDDAAGSDAGLTAASIVAAEDGFGIDDGARVETQTPFQIAADMASGAESFVIDLSATDAGAGTDAGVFAYRPTGQEVQLWTAHTIQLMEMASTLQLYAERDARV